MALPKRIRTNVARNIRRQLDTRIAQFRRAMDSTKSDILTQGYKQRIASLEEAKKGTYVTAQNEAGKRVQRSDEQITEGIQAASRELMSTRFASNRGRRNMASTQAQLNAASVNAESMYTKEEVRVFYRATQKAWQREGVSLKDRNVAILEYYGYENLSELVSDILALNRHALEKAKLTPQEDLTPEQKEALEQGDVKEAQQSPEYLMDVIEMPDPSGLAEIEKAE